MYGFGGSDSINVNNLVGYNVVGTVHTHTNGAAPVGGSFYLSFRTADISIPIPWNATGSQVHDALLSLPTIDTVEVTREEPRSGHGYTWIVTFIDVRLPTDEGLLMNGHHYLKAFVLDDPFIYVRWLCSASFAVFRSLS